MNILGDITKLPWTNEISPLPLLAFLAQPLSFSGSLFIKKNGHHLWLDLENENFKHVGTNLRPGPGRNFEVSFTVPEVGLYHT